jgi:hypothetical protein
MAGINSCVKVNDVFILFKLFADYFWIPVQIGKYSNYYKYPINGIFQILANYGPILSYIKIYE